MLNVTSERARQLATRERYSFPAPVITGPCRAWNRDDVERWMDDVNWWDRYPWHNLTPTSEVVSFYAEWRMRRIHR